MYDARTDKFGAGNVLRDVVAGVKSSVDNHNIEYKFTTSDSASDKANTLDVEAELSLSLQGGLVSAKGAGKFLTKAKANKRTVQGSMIFKRTTVQETLDLHHPSVPLSLNERAVSSGATHVVSAIQWGGSVVVTFTKMLDSADAATEASGELEAQMSNLATKISGSAKLDYSDKTLTSMSDYSVSVDGDVKLPDGITLPTTPEEAMSFLRNVPAYMDAMNDGKGAVMVYTLTPIADLPVDPTKLAALTVVKKLAAGNVTRIAMTLNRMAEARAAFDDAFDDVKAMTDVLPLAVVKKWGEYGTMLGAHEDDVRHALGEALVKFRSSEDFSAGDVLNAVNKMAQGGAEEDGEPGYGPAAVHAWVAENSEADNLQLLVSAYGVLRRAGITFLKRNADKSGEVLKYAGDLYMLHTATDMPRTPELAKLHASFLRLKRSAAGAAAPPRGGAGAGGAHGGAGAASAAGGDAGEAGFVIVDLSIHKSLRAGKTAPWIELYRGHDLFNPDFKEGAALTSTFQPAKDEFLRPTERKAPSGVSLRPLRLRCPASIGGACPLTEWEFKCARCGQGALGSDGSVYCECGATHVWELGYKCCSPAHGASFVRWADRDNLASFAGFAAGALPLTPSEAKATAARDKAAAEKAAAEKAAAAAAAEAAKPRVGYLRHVASGRMVHPHNGTAATGARLLLNDFVRERRLLWRLHADGSIESVTTGNFVHPEGGAGRRGCYLVCHPGGHEKRLAFRLQADGLLVHVESGLVWSPEGGVGRHDALLILHPDGGEPYRRFELVAE